MVEADKEYPYETYWIMFEGIEVGNILKKCGLPEHNGVIQFDKNIKCAEILKKVLFEIAPKNEFEESCLMQSAFYEIMALHMQSVNENLSSAYVARGTLEFIKKNYNQQIKISDLAKQYNFTRNYLSLLFKNEYGISPQEYLLTVRIKKAKLLLSDKTKNLLVNEVAYSVGFNDPLYFSRIFHRKTGISPSEFIKKNTKG